ncbi:MAG TPA: hypothetical protein VGJ94_01665 [Syntrophorhabdaceae bacterium]|jgi:hypothetical protein
MRLFTLLDYHHLVLAFFLGALSVLVLYLAFRRGALKIREHKHGALGQAEGLEEFPDGFKIEYNPVPLVLIFLYMGFIVWFVFYVIFFGFLGGPF